MPTEVFNDLEYIDALVDVIDMTAAISEVTTVDLSPVTDHRWVRSAVFNPSIAKVNNVPGEYIVCYRFNGSIKNPEFSTSSVLSTRHPNHPWTSGWNNELDGTGFIRAKLGPSNDGESKWHFSMIERIHLTGGEQAWSQLGFMNRCHDTRIYYDAPYDRYVLTYNIYSHGAAPMTMYNENDFNEEELTRLTTLKAACENGSRQCGHMGITYAKMKIHQASGRAHLEASKVHYACPLNSHYLEKNWTIWRMKNDPKENGLRLSYQLTPQHIYFESTKGSKFATCNRQHVVSSAPSAFAELQSRYKGSIVFSLSTPALSLDNRTSSMISVGHMKMQYQLVPDDLKKVVSDINRYIDNAAGSHEVHPTYYYFMFFYEFNRDTGEITKISPMFIPYDNEPYSVFFASGLELHGMHVLLSYGVGDVMTKVAVLYKDRIKAMLNETGIKLRFALLGKAGMDVPMNAVLFDPNGEAPMNVNSGTVNSGTVGGSKKKTKASRKKRVV